MGRAGAPAVAFFYSPDRDGEHPERHLPRYAGIMQADAYAGFNGLYKPGRKPGSITGAACWAHARRKLYELAAMSKAPIAAEAVQRINALFEIEHVIIGQTRGSPLGVSAYCRSLWICVPGCGTSGRASRARAPLPRRSITVSSAGTR